MVSVVYTLIVVSVVMIINFVSSFYLIAMFLIVKSKNSTYGTDFYIGSMKNYQGETKSYSLFLSTLSDSPISYTVKDFYNTTISTGNVSFSFPVNESISTTYVTQSNTEHDKGIHLSSTGPISVIVVNQKSGSIGEYPVYPKQIFPTSQYVYYSASPYSARDSSAKSEILLVGTDDNTMVILSPTVNVLVPADIQNLSNSAQKTLYARDSSVITLNRLQTLLIASGGLVDLTGTLIMSDKPITVISGHECANVPPNKVYCEHVEQQIPPTLTWGKKHLVRSFSGRNDDTYLLIVSSENNTSIRHNCEGSLLTFDLVLSGSHKVFSVRTDNSCYLESNKPILITQMMSGAGIKGSSGDPAVSVLPPIEQYTNEVVFYSCILNQNEFMNNSYINIVLQIKDIIVMDGLPLNIKWETISNFDGEIAGYSASLSVSDDVHYIHSKNGVPFHILVYGYEENNFVGCSFSASAGLLEQINEGE